MQTPDMAAGHRRKAWPGSKLTRRMRDQGYRRVVEVADAAGVHRTTVYRWIKDGVVQALDFQGAYYVKWDSVVEHLGKVAEILGLVGEGAGCADGHAAEDE